MAQRFPPPLSQRRTKVSDFEKTTERKAEEYANMEHDRRTEEPKPDAWYRTRRAYIAGRAGPRESMKILASALERINGFCEHDEAGGELCDCSTQMSHDAERAIAEVKARGDYPLE